MNLTYELINNGTGYMIFLEGKAWIKQDSYIPYKGKTMEESAQNHINAIIEDSNKPVEKTIEEKYNELFQKQELIQIALDEMILGGTL